LVFLDGAERETTRVRAARIEFREYSSVDELLAVTTCYPKHRRRGLLAPARGERERPAALVESYRVAVDELAATNDPALAPMTRELVSLLLDAELELAQIDGPLSRLVDAS